MADRFPLIVNNSANAIQELAASDNLDLASSNIVNVVDITATGNVSVGGTLTYEDVTNIDSVGIITAREGIKVLAGGMDMKGILQEKCKINTTQKLNEAPNIDLADGMVHHFTTTETTTSTPNIRVNGSTTLDSAMAVGDTVSVTIITTAAAGGYSASFTIDGNANGVGGYTIATRFVGGSAPTTGGASGNDIYALQIIKTAGSTFTIIANLTNAA